MGIFNFGFLGKEKREFEAVGKKDDLAKIFGLDSDKTTITRSMAMQIPALKAGICYIADLVSSLEIKLYKEVDGKVETISDDYRLRLLNDETGDLLNSFQMKQSLVRDFILAGNGYLYINKDGNSIVSLHYIKPSLVSVVPGVNPIFKDGKLFVDGEEYESYDFVIFAQNTQDGLTGKGLLDESRDLLELAYNTLAFANNNIKAGGIKRGVVKSTKKLSQEAMTFLKKSWGELYDNTSNKNNKVIILNDGLDFQELSQTSIELQVLENRKVNDNDILNLIKIPLNILNGTATEQQYNNFIKITIIPILEQLESAFNAALLFESEKQNKYYFAFETKDLLKGSAKERFETYKTAIEAGVITQNEARFMENYDSLEGLDNIKMSLGHVLYNPGNKEYYVPNTGQVVNGKGVKELNENGNKE